MENKVNIPVQVITTTDVNMLYSLIAQRKNNRYGSNIPRNITISRANCEGHLRRSAVGLIYLLNQKKILPLPQASQISGVAKLEIVKTVYIYITPILSPTELNMHTSEGEET